MKIIKTFEQFSIDPISDYIDGRISEIELENLIIRGITESLLDTGKMIIDTILGYISKIVESISKIGKKIFTIIDIIIRSLGKFCDRNKIICSLIFCIMVFLLVTVTTAYASSNPNNTEMINASLGYLERFNDHLSSEHGDRILSLAKSILTDLRDGKITDYKSLGDPGKNAQSMVNAAMEMVKDIKIKNPNEYGNLIETGVNVFSRFVREVNGHLTVIGRLK
jgi:hypothetical protein